MELIGHVQSFIIERVNGGVGICDAKVVCTFEVVEPSCAKDDLGFTLLGADIIDALVAWIYPVTCIEDEAIFLPWFDEESLGSEHKVWNELCSPFRQWNDPLVTIFLVEGLGNSFWFGIDRVVVAIMEGRMEVCCANGAFHMVECSGSKGPLKGFADIWWCNSMYEW